MRAEFPFYAIVEGSIMKKEMFLGYTINVQPTSTSDQSPIVVIALKKLFYCILWSHLMMVIAYRVIDLFFISKHLSLPPD